MSAPYHVLIVGVENPARAVITECLLRHKGQGRFDTCIAASEATGPAELMVAEIMKDRFGLDTAGARRQTWAELQGVEFDFVIAVYDSARELSARSLGLPISVALVVPDPADYEGTAAAKRGFYVEVALLISRRLDLFCALSQTELERERLRVRLGTGKASAGPAA